MIVCSESGDALWQCSVENQWSGKHVQVISWPFKFGAQYRTVDEVRRENIGTEGRKPATKLTSKGASR